MMKSSFLAALAITGLAGFGLVGACSSDNTTTVPPENTSGGTSGTSGASGTSGTSGGTDGGSSGSEAGPGACDLKAVAGAAAVDSTFTIYDPPGTVPVATTGGTLSGQFKVTKAKVFLPSATKGLADPAKSKGTVTGWAVFEGTRYRIKLDAALTINSVLGDRAQNINVDSQGGFTVEGSALKVDQACDGPDGGTDAAYTFTASGSTATLVVKTPVATFGDAYLEIEASK